MGRLSRKEQQRRTRGKLLKAAAKLFSCHGLQSASVDDVAREAGYTKGAFYANFKSKEELFLAMLDERFAAHAERLEAALAPGDGERLDAAREGGADFAAHVAGDPEWQRLFFEFAAHAARDDGFREELVTRYRYLQDTLAAHVDRVASARAVELSPEVRSKIALMVFVMGNGFALEKLLEPDLDEALYPEMLAFFFRGLTASLEEAGAAAGAE